MLTLSAERCVQFTLNFAITIGIMALLAYFAGHALVGNDWLFAFGMSITLIALSERKPQLNNDSAAILSSHAVAIAEANSLTERFVASVDQFINAGEPDDKTQHFDWLYQMYADKRPDISKAMVEETISDAIEFEKVERNLRAQRNRSAMKTVH